MYKLSLSVLKMICRAIKFYGYQVFNIHHSTAELKNKCHVLELFKRRRMQSAPGPPSPSLSFMLSVDSHQTGFDTGINHQQLPHPRPIYTTPHSPPQFFFGAVGKVKVYT